MPDGTPPRVFISYSHDDAAHEERVLRLANRLRAEGIDASVDQYVQPFPPEGWEEWSEAQVRTADFVVMVCTETYLQRFNRDAPPGVGHGVLWEAKAIRALLYSAGTASRSVVPVLFAGGGRDHVPLPLRGGYISRIETDAGYDRLYRLLTGQPYVRKPEVGAIRRRPVRQAPAATAVENPLPPVASMPHPRVEDLFVGRRVEREQLAAALFPAEGRRRPVVVSGMPGVGKSYLVDRFYWENTARFPGGYLRLALDPVNPGSAAELLAGLHDRLKLPAGDGEALAARLSTPLTLVHIENADTFPAGRMVGQAAAALPGCAPVISARFRDLGFAAAWGQVPLLPFDEATTLQQLAAELPAEIPGRESWPALAGALGHLPWPCISPPDICGPATVPPPSSAACGISNWPSTAPIRQTPRFGFAAAPLVGYLRSVARRAAAARCHRRRGLGRRPVGARPCAGYRVRGEPWCRNLGPHRRGVRGHGARGHPAVPARSGATWRGRRIPPASAVG